MKLPRVRASRAILSLGLLAGCTGQIGDAGGDTGNLSGAHSGGAVGSTGTGGSGGARPSGTGAGGAPSDGAGGTPSGSGGSPMGQAGSLDLSGSPKYYRVIRLTNAQWAAAVQTVLNISAGGLEQNFESPVYGMTAFSNIELVLGFDSRNWQDYQSAAEALATQVTASASAQAKVYSGTDAAGLITPVGRGAYRGISARLQSPNFLFRTELGAQGAPLSGYEMAAKLALWLRGTGPDDKTLDMAGGTGKLDTADGAAALTQTMLGETATANVMRQFHGEWLHFDDYEQITKVNVPSFTDALPAELEEASYRFFDNIFTQGLGLKDMLLSTSGFYGPQMAKLYGVTAPANGYAQSDLGSKRVGVFAQIPYLTLNGLNAEPNSILRGVTLNLDVLCATLGPTAANIPPIPPLQPGQTNRQRIDTLTGTCGMSCHND